MSSPSVPKLPAFKRTLLQKELGYPIYSMYTLEDLDALIVIGGGGRAKTGIFNHIQVYKLAGGVEALSAAPSTPKKGNVENVTAESHDDNYESENRRVTRSAAKKQREKEGSEKKAAHDLTYDDTLSAVSSKEPATARDNKGRSDTSSPSSSDALSLNLVVSLDLLDVPISMDFSKKAHTLAVVTGPCCKLYKLNPEKLQLQPNSSKESDIPALAEDAKGFSMVRFSSDSKYLVVGLESGEIRAYHFPSLRLSSTLVAVHKSSIVDMTVSDALIVSVSSDKTCSVSRLIPSKKSLEKAEDEPDIADKNDNVLGKLVSPVSAKSNVLSAASSSGSGQSAKPAKSAKSAKLALLQLIHPRCCRFHPTRSDVLVTGDGSMSKGSYICVWRLDTVNNKFECVSTQRVLNHAITLLEFNADGSMVLAGSASATVAIFSLYFSHVPSIANRQLFQVNLIPIWTTERTVPLLTETIQLHELPITSLGFMRQSSLVVTGAPDYRITVNGVSPKQGNLDLAFMKVSPTMSIYLVSLAWLVLILAILIALLPKLKLV